MSTTSTDATRALVVGLGGFFGALTRYGVGLLVARVWTKGFPLATLLINVTGSLLLGFFSTYAAARSGLDARWRLLIATGFVGAYTTFSTFEYETWALVEGGAPWRALANVLVSVIAGFAAVWLGVTLAR